MLTLILQITDKLTGNKSQNIQAKKKDVLDGASGTRSTNGAGGDNKNLSNTKKLKN